MHYDHKNIGTKEESKDDATQTILAGTNLILNILSSTLGPSGNMKIMTNNTHKNMIVSNDGATILKNLLVDSPSAQLLINTSISQDKAEGDGTTSVALLSALLVREASLLNIHPVKIVRGYQMALEHCLSKLKGLTVEYDPINLVKTTLSSKVLRCDLNLFSNICNKAISNLDDKNIGLINIIKCVGKLEDSFYVDGFILDKDIEIPTIENPKILVANTSLDYDKIKVFGAKVQVSSIKELSNIEEAEKQKMREKIDRITLKDNKPFYDVFINRQLIYDFPMELFKRNKVIPIEHADFIGIERLGKILNGKILSSFYEGVKIEDLGTCGRIENINLNGKNMIKFSGVQKGAGTIVLFGSSDDILDEAERSIHDALCVLREKEIVCGGGSIENAMNRYLSEYAKTIKGIESEAIYAFGRALMEIPKIIANNCGFDGEEIKTLLKNDDNIFAGVSVDNQIADMREKGIFECLSVKKRVLIGACESAQVLIKCDGFVKCKERERTRE